MKLEYRDTREFIPVDVDKGIDRLTGEFVQADAEAPKGYTQLPKCKFCANYVEEASFKGICGASTQEPKFMAYGDMTAITCEMFEAK
ncbi:4-hydroxyphenylacetate decarboxylase small subunit [Salidesulfovibrio onnuriiensis]|uniref:4-hydroxyphenylacetate decarboxylase small subunit n=1 Tax=Salidesulfovibrio onnuriiensis TaxID=2583823 RepID=UPI0011C8BB84|nr:4-hydroxyphenylacetate decarboxylase small subunit [Salidesulfovibrio onnuriiensis]